MHPGAMCSRADARLTPALKVANRATSHSTNTNAFEGDTS